MQPFAFLYSDGQYPYLPTIQDDLVEDAKSVAGTATQFPRCPKGARGLLKPLPIARLLVGSDGELNFDRLLQQPKVLSLHRLYMSVNLGSVEKGIEESLCHGL